METFLLLLFLPLLVNIGVIWLSFLNWYERELKMGKAFSISLIIAIIILAGIHFSLNKIPTDLLETYKILSTTLFFLVFPELYLLIEWARKGVHRAFLVLAVAAYIATFWLLLPLGYQLIPNLDARARLAATYVSGVILGTLTSIGVIEEVRPKDGYITASAATAALSISDSVSHKIYELSIFTDTRIQLAILAISSIISYILYKRATE